MSCSLISYEEPKVRLAPRSVAFLIEGLLEDEGAVVGSGSWEI